MHPHRSSALGYASAASAAHSRLYGACAAEAAVSEALGLSVGGCPRARRYFGPHPVPVSLIPPKIKFRDGERSNAACREHDCRHCCRHGR